MRTALLVLMLLAAATSAGFGATHHVPDDFPTIQAAIDSPAVQEGDTVVVRPGTYKENLDFKGRALRIESESGPGSTVIDGNQAGTVVAFTSGEGPDSMLVGFTVTNGHAGDAGGILCHLFSSPTLQGNAITGNQADQGGGVCCQNLPSMLSGNVIAGNKAVHEGGGVYCWRSNSTYTGNRIHGNEAERGGGMYFMESAPLVTNETVYGNVAQVRGAGLHETPLYAPSIMNTIIWGNVPDALQEITMVCFCDVEGGCGGPGNIDLDPRFVDAAAGDFHLRFDSPCRDKGVNSAPALPDLDFEGDPRIAYGTADMGADEFHPHLYCTGDLCPGGKAALKFIGVPGAAPVFLWVGSGVLDPPMPTIFGDWHLQFPLLLELNLGAIPHPEGVAVLGFTLPPDLPVPAEIPTQGAVGSELLNLCTLSIE